MYRIHLNVKDNCCSCCNRNLTECPAFNNSDGIIILLRSILKKCNTHALYFSFTLQRCWRTVNILLQPTENKTFADSHDKNVVYTEEKPKI